MSHKAEVMVAGEKDWVGKGGENARGIACLQTAGVLTIA